MSGDYFWGCVEAMAATLDGSPQETEQNLSDHVTQCMQFTAQRCTDVRRQLVRIIGGLAHLETRLADKVPY